MKKTTVRLTGLIIHALYTTLQTTEIFTRKNKNQTRA